MRSIRRFRSIYRVAACLTLLAVWSVRAPVCPAQTQVEMPAFHTLTKMVEGPELKDLKAKAELEAVRSCIGRLYFSNKLIMAEDLLEKYIAQNYEQFISEAHLNDSASFKDKARQTWKVVVRFAKLRADLAQKRFLYEPRLSPYYAVMLQERRNGQPTLNDDARQIMMLAFDDYNKKYRDPNNDANAKFFILKDEFRVMDREFQKLTPPQTDVSELPEAQRQQILVAAKRMGIELLVTGYIDISDKGTQSIYLHENFFYNEIKIKLKVIRVDNGTLLYDYDDYYKYTDRSAPSLQQTSVKKIVEMFANKAAERFNPAWRRTILNMTDYQLLLTNVGPDETKIVHDLILSLPGAIVKEADGGEVKEQIVKPMVYKRNVYSDSAVLTVLHKGPRESLMALLTSIQHPRLVVVVESKKQIWVEQVK